ncbi:MAG: D-tagatose 3-epimerase [candidate division BRC1 bacterium ADurb.BinA364]|nr:MAG: D-tagatose 3-epimerase [candidate division BRC1 bacterium ADurb.BinA364]
MPDGYDRAKAWEQIVAFLRVCAPLAAANGATIVIEPLRSQESNIINSVAEGAQLARDVDRPAIQLLVDGFHWAVNDRSIEAIVDNGPILRHAHIATTPNRRPPGAEECDLATFFQALKKSGYDARISIEGKIENPELELPAALKIMKALWER